MERRQGRGSLVDRHAYRHHRAAGLLHGRERAIYRRDGGLGGAIVAFAPEPASAVQQNGNNNGKILVFKLGGKKAIEPSKIDRGPMAKPPEETAAADLVQKGEGPYHRYCAVCHGFLVASAGIVPDLKFSSAEIFARYKEIVLGGELKDRGMASFADQLKPEDVEAIHAYVLRMANVTFRAANNIPEPEPARPARPARSGRRGR